MRRRYNVEKYLDLVEKIKSIRPEMSFSSDFIVGFPGETKEDFAKTMDIVNEVKFDESFSFIYSPRPNTPASDMPDDVSAEEKKERLDILQSRLSQFSFGYSRKWLELYKIAWLWANQKEILDNYKLEQSVIE